MHLSQSLEPRRLMAATISQGLLTVTGTESADQISLSIGNAAVDVNINGVVQSIGAVKKIRVFGLGGDDTIEISRSITRHASIDAGAGNDNVLGGGGSDTIAGFTGDDLIYGNVGDDVLRGGDGNDTLRGNAGVDAVLGEGGDDLLLGDGREPKIDKVDPKADYLDGGSGNDSVDYSLAESEYTNFRITTVVGEGSTTFSDITTAYIELTNSSMHARAANFETLTGTRSAYFWINVSGGATEKTPVRKPLLIQSAPQAGASFNYGGSGRIAALDVTLRGGNGGDEFAYDGDNDVHPVSIIGGGGGDEVRISGSVGTSDLTGVDLGAGNDTLNVVGEWVSTNYVMPAWLENISIENALPTGGTVTGNVADNRISVMGPEMNIIAGAGNDYIFGGSNVDAGDGDDTVYQSSGTVNLGEGDDYYESQGSLFVAINGQGGNDRIFAQYTPASAGVITSLTGGDGDDTIYGTLGDDLIDVGLGQNYVEAFAGNDRILAGVNNLRDVILGGDGNDTLEGDAIDRALGIETRTPA